MVRDPARPLRRFACALARRARPRPQRVPRWTYSMRLARPTTRSQVSGSVPRRALRGPGVRHGRDAALRLRVSRRGFRPGDARDAGCAGAPRSARRPRRTSCIRGSALGRVHRPLPRQRARRRARVHAAPRGAPDARVRVPDGTAASVGRRMEPIRRTRMGEPGREWSPGEASKYCSSGSPSVRGPQA